MLKKNTIKKAVKNKHVTQKAKVDACLEIHVK